MDKITFVRALKRKTRIEDLESKLAIANIEKTSYKKIAEKAVQQLQEYSPKKAEPHVEKLKCLNRSTST